MGGFIVKGGSVLLGSFSDETPPPPPQADPKRRPTPRATEGQVFGGFVCCLQFFA